MLPYKNLIYIDREGKSSLYKQIAYQLVELIQNGILLPGSKLPSTRCLSDDLKVHRKTIVAVYDILVSENWVENLPRKGYRISPILPVMRPRTYRKKCSPFASKPSFVFDNQGVPEIPMCPESSKNIIINDGLPDTTLLPYSSLARDFRKALDRVTTTNDLPYRFEKPCLKMSLCKFLNQTRGINFDEENLCVTRGSQMALYLAATLILKKGDKVVMADPCYRIAEALFEKFGAEIIRVPIDHQGMRSDILEEVLIKNNIKLIYIIPHHHNPTTVAMSMERRDRILELIKIYKPAVIEDDNDYDFQFEYDCYMPLACGDHGGNVIYIGSLTKVMGPAFRMGYMIASREFLKVIEKIRVLIDIRSDFFTERAVAAMIDRGDLARLIQKTNKIYAERCEILCKLLDTELKDYISYSRPSGGLAIWVMFKEEYNLSEIAKFAYQNGLSIKSDFYFNRKNKCYNAFRFGFASLNKSKLAAAVAILKQAVRHLYLKNPLKGQRLLAKTENDGYYNSVSEIQSRRHSEI